MAKKKKAQGFKKFLIDYRLEIGAVGLVLLLWGAIWVWNNNPLGYITANEEVETIDDSISGDDTAPADQESNEAASDNPDTATDSAAN